MRHTLDRKAENGDTQKAAHTPARRDASYSPRPGSPTSAGIRNCRSLNQTNSQHQARDGTRPSPGPPLRRDSSTHSRVDPAATSVKVCRGSHRYRFLIHDRDSIYSQKLDQEFSALGVRILRTTVRAPKAKACASHCGSSTHCVTTRLAAARFDSLTPWAFRGPFSQGIIAERKQMLQVINNTRNSWRE